MWQDFVVLDIMRLSKPVFNLFRIDTTLSTLDFRGDCFLSAIKGIKLV